MNNDTEIVETLRQLNEVVVGLGRQISGVSSNVHELSKSTKSLNAASVAYTKELTATIKKVRESSPLSANSDTPKQNATDAALLAEAKRQKQMLDVYNESIKRLNPDDPDGVTDQDKKIDAILKGQEVIAGHLSNNPYLGKINELHKAVVEANEKKRKGSIAGKLEDFGARSGNPLGRMLGHLGGSVNSMRSAGVTLGNAGSYMFGGGRQAHKAEKRIEIARRDNERDTPLLNAYAARQMEINTQLKSKNLSTENRQSLMVELADINAKHGDIQKRIQTRSTEMAGDTFKTLQYNDRRLNKKQYKSYNSDEQKIIAAHLKSNIDKSFDVGKKFNVQNTLMGALGLDSTSSNKNTIGTKIRTAVESKVLTAGNANVNGSAKRLHDLRNTYNERIANGAQPNDPLMLHMMKEMTTMKADGKKTALVANTLGRKIKSASDKKKENLLDVKLTGSIDRPVTAGDHIMSISSSMRAVKTGLMSKAKEKVSGVVTTATGGLGLKSILGTLLAGAAIAAIGQTVLKSFGLGNGSAGSSVSDDIFMKGGRRVANVVSRNAAAKFGANVGVRGGAKIVANTAKTAGFKAAAKTGGKLAAKGVGKSLVKKIPLIGAGAGLMFAGQRAAKGDFMGAGLEATSGFASLIPGVGTALSAIIDVGLVAKDLSNTAKKDAKAKQVAIDNKYSEKHGFKSSVSKVANIELSSARLNKKYSDAQQKEMYAKLAARMHAEEMLNGLGRNISVRDAHINAKATTTALVG